MYYSGDEQGKVIRGRKKEGSYFIYSASGIDSFYRFLQGGPENDSGELC